MIDPHLIGYGVFFIVLIIQSVIIGWLQSDYQRFRRESRDWEREAQKWNKYYKDLKKDIEKPKIKKEFNEGC